MGRAGRTVAAALAAALCAAWPGAASAQLGPKTDRPEALSPYEQESLDAALGALHTTVDPSPEGKVYEGVDVVPLEVLEERDPFDGWGVLCPTSVVCFPSRGSKVGVHDVLNALHTTTRKRVIEREILLSRGDPYEQAVVDQTTRNLRALTPLSLVVVVPVRGTAQDRVRLLVITKDVWSLRLNSDIQVGPGGLEQLLLEPTESNLAGVHDAVITHFLLLPKSYQLGAGFSDRRLAGTRQQLGATVYVDVNRDSGKPEGTAGTVTTGVPLYSLKQEWAWTMSTSWANTMVRRYVNAQLAAFDAKATPQVDGIPFEYRGTRFLQTANVTRSFGYALKNDFTLGAEVNKVGYRTDDLTRFDPTAVAEFVRRDVPVGDTRVGPFLQWRTYATDYLEVLDNETLALQEDYRVGHNVYARVYPVLSVLGSTNDFVGGYVGAEYTVKLGTGLARASVESDTEAAGDGLRDASLGARFHLATPRAFFGRVIVDVGGLNRYRNHLNRLTSLGGNNRLRGYPSNFYLGKDWAAANVELRTRAIEVLGSELAGAVFYDAGDAMNGFDTMRPKQSVGAGFRFLFPQLDRFVLRGDFGFPLGQRDPGVAAMGFFIAFQQAFGLDSISGPAGSGALGQ